MENYLYLSGASMYIFLCMLIFIMVAAIVLGKAYIDEKENNQKSKEIIKILKSENKVLKNKIYQMNFKVPNVEESENV